MKRFVRCATIGLLASTISACMGPLDISRAAPGMRPCALVEDGTHDIVDWYRPRAPEDREKLDAWCQTLGPIVLDTVPGADFGPLGPTERLTIAVWNTNGGAGHLMAFMRDELGLICDGRDSVLLPHRSHFVLLAQEALRRSNEIPDVPKSWATPPPVTEEKRSGERRDIVNVAMSCGLSLFYTAAARNGPEARDGLREDKGNAVLSTLSLTEPAAVELPYEAARRVVPIATIRNNAGGAVRLASVHFITTPPPWRIFLTGNSARLRQALALTDALRQVEAGRAASGLSTVATVLAGDLNTFSRRETALRQLLTDFPDSPPFLAEPTRPPFPTDHLLLRSGEGLGGEIIEGTYRRADHSYHSDHYPILGDLSLEGAGGL